MECSVQMWSAWFVVCEAGGRLKRGGHSWQAERCKVFFLTKAIAATLPLPLSLSKMCHVQTNVQKHHLSFYLENNWLTECYICNSGKNRPKKTQMMRWRGKKMKAPYIKAIPLSNIQLLINPFLTTQITYEETKAPK